MWGGGGALLVLGLQLLSPLGRELPRHARLGAGHLGRVRVRVRVGARVGFRLGVRVRVSVRVRG